MKKLEDLSIISKKLQSMHRIGSIEHKETKRTELINKLKKGEKTEFVKDFNRESFLTSLHIKYSIKK